MRKQMRTTAVSLLAIGLLAGCAKAPAETSTAAVTQEASVQQEAD